MLPGVTWRMPPKNSKVKSSQANAAKAAKEAAKRHGQNQVTAHEIASVCLLLRHFIHGLTTFATFSVLSRRSSRGARLCGAGLSLSSLLSSVSSLFCVLLCSLFALLSPLLSFPSPRVPVGSPRPSPVFCLIVCSLSFPHVPLLSPLFLSPCCPSSLFSPRSPLLA